MAKTAAKRVEEALHRLDGRFAGRRLFNEWVAAIEAAVAEERARCAAIVRAEFTSKGASEVLKDIERGDAP